MSISNIIAGVILGFGLLVIVWIILGSPIIQFILAIYFSAVAVCGFGAWAINHLMGDR